MGGWKKCKQKTPSYFVFFLIPKSKEFLIFPIKKWQKTNHEFGGWEGRNLTWVVLSQVFFSSIFHSNPVTASEKKEKKKHYFLSRSTAASAQTWLFFMCEKLAGFRLLRQNGDHPQPWECKHSTRVSLLGSQKLSPTLQVASEPLPQAVCNLNQITPDFRPSSGNLIIFLPLSDGRWQVEGKENGGVKN